MNQGDHKLIDQLEFRLPIDREKIFRSSGCYGHMGASDCFFAYKDRLDKGAIKPGDHIVCASSAVGFSWGATVIRV